jgi:hypothetical protein
MENDKQIRLAIKELIKNLYFNAQIYAWNALSHDINEWAGMFRCPKDDNTHGWIIKRAALQGTRKNARRDKKTLVYDVWGFYKFKTDETTNEMSNSDNEFGEITDAIYEVVKDSHNLNLSGLVEYHDLIQFPSITTLKSGEETLHFAQGRLVVHLCC